MGFYFSHARVKEKEMINCIEREGTKGCSWWWNGSCHNLHVPLNVKLQCSGNLPRLSKTA